MISPSRRGHNRLTMQGNSGYFLPASRVWFIDMSPSMFKSLLKQWPMPRPFPEQTLDQNIHAADYLHEELHFVQYSGTSIGFLETCIELAKTNLTHSVLGSLREKGVSQLPVPLTHSAALKELPQQSTLRVAEFQRLYKNLRTLGDAIRGDTELCQSQVRQAVMSLRNDWPSLGLGVQYTDLGLGRLKWNEQNLARPAGQTALHKTTGTIYILGSNHAYESWATAIELVFLRGVTDVGQFHTLEEERVFGPYSTIMGMLAHNWPQFSMEPYESMLLHTAAVCELSLCPPLLHDQPEELTWEELQPGYRLNSIVSALARHEIRPINFGDVEAEYRRFVQDVCLAIGWKAPFVLGHTAHVLDRRVPAIDLQVCFWKSKRPV